MKNRVAIVYHSQDVDGFMSAILMQMLYDENHKVKLIPYNYESESDFMTGTFDEYVFGDVTPPIDWFKNNLGKKITIFDHHKLRIDKLNIMIGVDEKHILTNHIIVDGKPKFQIHNTYNDNLNISIYFSEKLSGCGIIFHEKRKHITRAHSDGVLCNLVDLISSYDTWQFDKFEKNERDVVLNFQTAIGMYRNLKDFQIFFDDIKNDNLIFNIRTVVEHGMIINNFQKHQITEQIKNGEYRNTITLGNVFFIETRHLCYLTQEEIFKLHEDVDYIIGFHFKNEFTEMQFSMRSKKHSDVGSLCEKIGNGGGHQKAGGFTIDTGKGMEFVINL